MVLFADDFARERAIVDFKTTNLSFLKMASVLDQMGVKNSMFHLALYDKDLVGVDPFNLQDDSLELKQRIAYEAKRNLFYFLRELIRVTASGTGGVPYILNRANLAQAWCFANSINSFLVMPRQIGKTIGSMSLADWYLYLAGYNVKFGEFCKGIKLQNENVDRLKKLRDALPPWLLHQTMRDTNNKEGIAYDALKTELLTFVAQSDKQAAGDLARGQSISVMHWDEIAFFDNIYLSFDQVKATMDAAGEQARESGLPSAVLLTTTAGDIDDPRGRWCYRMACDAMRFTEKLYDCESHGDLMSLLRANSKNLFLYLEYSYKQLGKDEDWFERVTRGKNSRVIERDYLNHWTHGSDQSIFQKELLDKIQASKRDPVATTNYESLLIRWYDDPKKLRSDPTLRDKPYVIGCDTSDNVGRDFTTMCMVDPYDLHIVCTFKCNTTNLLFVARCILNLLKDFPRSIFIPERNKNGAMFLDFIFADMKRDYFNPITRIYNKFVQEYTSDTDLHDLDYRDGNVRKMFGFSTTKAATSREALYSSVLMTSLELVGDRLYDASIVDEISGLTTKNGRVDHSDIGHDDLLIAFLLACWFILFGQNHQLYGIRPDEFMCNIRGKSGDMIDAEEKKRIAAMQKQIVDLKSRLKRAPNLIVKSAYQRELNKLISMVGDVEVDDTIIKSLDQVNQEATMESRVRSGIDLHSALDFM